MLARIKELVAQAKVRASQHGYNELAKDRLFYAELVDGLERAIVVDEYPNYAKGPCVLVLQHNPDGSPVHVL